jgi:hypothetical protein
VVCKLLLTTTADLRPQRSWRNMSGEKMESDNVLHRQCKIKIQTLFPARRCIFIRPNPPRRGRWPPSTHLSCAGQTSDATGGGIGLNITDDAGQLRVAGVGKKVQFAGALCVDNDTVPISEESRMRCCASNTSRDTVCGHTNND